MSAPTDMKCWSVAHLTATEPKTTSNAIRRGKLRVTTGPVFSGSKTKKNILLSVPFSFNNPAPATLTVVDLKLRIEGGTVYDDSLPARMFWIATHDSVYPKNKEHMEFMRPFSIDGRKTVEQVIEFQILDPTTQLDSGPYTVTLEAMVIPQRLGKKKWQDVCSYQLLTDWDSPERLMARTNDPSFHP